jgi:hypothetical protein
VNTVEEAIALYMEAFRSKYNSQLHAQRREWNLGRFVDFLRSRGHTVRLAELRMADAQDFLDRLVNARNGAALSRAMECERLSRIH